MPPKPLLAVVAVVLAACSGDDGGEGPASTTAPSGRCPVPAAVVADALARSVAVERAAPPAQGCTYLGDGEDGAGARVEIVVRSLGDEPYGDVLAEVERRAGPTVALRAGDVDGADRGWVATVGRAVQVGAADSETLVVVAVTDVLLDAEAAEEVATALAGEALSG